MEAPFFVRLAQKLSAKMRRPASPQVGVDKDRVLTLWAS